MTDAGEKVSPERLELRARPRPIRRLNKRTLMIGCAIVVLVIAGATIMALSPPTLFAPGQPSELYNTERKQTAEGLEKLPKSYGEIPPLGPPVPGDIGRALVEGEKRLGVRPPAPDTSFQPNPEEEAERAERIRQARLAQQPSPHTILAGSVIAASLVTGINSDLPGMTIAQVTENTFDTVTGEHLLIPQGTRLIGKYDHVVAFGQKRALLVWTRIILPNGNSILIENLPATDAAGYAGLEDEVDFHTWQLLKGIGLATILGVGTQLTLGNTEGDLVRALRESIQQTTNRAGQRLIERELDVQPTITVRPGWPVRVIVAKDLVLKPYVEAQARRQK